MLREKTVEYLEGALKKAQEDLARIERGIDKFINVDHRDRLALKEHIRLYESGYDLNKEIVKRVEAEVVCSELAQMIWSEQRKIDERMGKI